MYRELSRTAGADVLIVHQLPLMRRALAMALAQDQSLRIVASTGFGALGMALARRDPPDVVVVEANNATRSSIAFIVELRSVAPDAAILALLPEDDLVGAGELRAAGVTSFIDSYALPVEILAAVRGHCSELPTSGDPRAAERGSTEAGSQLDASDVRMLELVAEGLTDAQIAQSLFVSGRTVQTHLARLRSTTGSRNRAQLISWFVRSAAAPAER